MQATIRLLAYIIGVGSPARSSRAHPAASHLQAPAKAQHGECVGLQLAESWVRSPARSQSAAAAFESVDPPPGNHRCVYSSSGKRLAGVGDRASSQLPVHRDLDWASKQDSSAITQAAAGQVPYLGSYIALHRSALSSCALWWFAWRPLAQ